MRRSGGVIAMKTMKKKRQKTEMKKKVDGEDVMISVVERDGWIRAGEAAEITIDSAADEWCARSSGGTCSSSRRSRLDKRSSCN